MGGGFFNHENLDKVVEVKNIVVCDDTDHGCGISRGKRLRSSSLARSK